VLLQLLQSSQNLPLSQDKALNEAGLQLPCSGSVSKSSQGIGCPGGTPGMLKCWRGCREKPLPDHEECGQRAALHHADTVLPPRKSSSGTHGRGSQRAPKPCLPHERVPLPCGQTATGKCVRPNTQLPSWQPPAPTRPTTQIPRAA